MLSILLLACALGDEPTATGTLTTAFRERARVIPGIKNDPACNCLHENPPKNDDLLVTEAGAVKNGIVWVSAGLEAKAPPAPAAPVVLNQKGCLYAPRVVALRVGQALEFHSDDNLLHNVHGLPFDNKEFNFGIQKGHVVERKFDKPEVFKVKCDVHPWMGAWIGVFEHPYFAISDAEGRFTIQGLPAGKYTLSVFHERLKADAVPIVVEGKETKIAPIDLVEKK